MFFMSSETTVATSVNSSLSSPPNKVDADARSGGVVVVVHSATGGVADVAPTERARRAESSTWFTPGSSGHCRRGTAAVPIWRRSRLRARLGGSPGLVWTLRPWCFLHFGSHHLNSFQEIAFASLDAIGGGGLSGPGQSLPGEP